MMARHRQHLGALLLWSLLCGLFFATLLLGWEHLPPGDFTGQFHAFAQFQAREMAQGRLPVWSPGSYGGFPFAGDVQSAAFYPLRWLSILLSLPWGFSLYVLQLEAILHVWLAGAFTYGLAFVLTRSRAAALLAAVAFALGGYLTAYPLLQLAILETITWMPLILLCIWMASRRRQPLRWLVGAGLLLALSALAGHPQTFLHVGYVAALYFLFRTMQARWSLRWIMGGGALLLLVPAGVAAMSWLPALRWTLSSTRADVSYDFVAAGQLLLNYLQLFVPGVRAFWSPEYVGVATLLLALVAWFGRGSVRQLLGPPLLPGGRLEIVFWAALALFGAWLALGEDGLIFRLFYRGAPGFSLFRRQERLLGVASFSLALTAAQGLALWRRLPSSQRHRSLMPATVVFVAGMLVTGAYLAWSPGSDPFGVWGRQWLIGGLVLLLLWLERRHRLLVLALLLLLGADLYVGTYTAMDRRAGGSFSYWQKPAWLQDLPDGPEPARIDTQGHFYANVGEIYGLEDVHGLSPLKSRLLADLEERLSPQRLWRLLGVTHVVSDEPPQATATRVAPVQEGLEPGRTVAASLYRLSDPLPRAWLSYEPLQAAGKEQALQLLADPGFDAAQQVVVHGDLPGLSGVMPPEAPPDVSVSRLEANVLRVEVETETSGLLVFSEWRYPGWRATVDGAPAELYATNYAFQSLLVPAGSHTVTLRFVPADVVAGGLVTALALLVVFVVAWRRQPMVSVRARDAWAPRPLRLPALPGGIQEFGDRALTFVTVHRRAILLTIILLGFALRFFHLGVQELRGDEAYSFLLAQMPLDEIIPTVVSSGDPHSPVHYLLLGGWMRLMGDSEFAMRVPSALAGVLLLPLAFHLGRRLWSARLGLLLTGLFALSQSQIWLAQDVRSQYVLALLFTLLATLLLARAAAVTGARSWLLYALCCALALYSHYYSLFVLLAHGLYMVAGGRRPRRVIAWGAAATTAVLLFLPWLVLGAGGSIGQLNDPGGVELAPYLFTVGSELLAGPALESDTSRWLVLGAALLSFLGWLTLWQRRRSWAALLGGWLGLTALGIYLVTLRRATFNPFYIAVAAPAWWALFAAGALTLWQRRGRCRPLVRGLAAAAVFVALALSAISLGRYYGDPGRFGRTVGYRRLAGHVAANWQPGDLFLANFPDPSLVYYLRDVPVTFQVEPAAADAAAVETEQSLAALADAHRRLWFVPARRAFWDAQAVTLRWLDYHLLLEEERRFQDLTVQAYRPLQAAEGLLISVQREMGGVLQLEGAYVTVNGRRAGSCTESVAAAPGDGLNVSLLWRAQGPIADNYTVFVHLLGADGRLLTQHDGVPAQATRPTTTWEVGERILDEHLLVLPDGLHAGERATLVVGLYDSTTLERQPFAGGQETVQLCNIVISP